MALSIKPYIENKERIHLIGIGGVSMNSLGELLLSRGVPISGSDRLRTDVTARLEALGAKITYEHKPENVEGASLIVRTAAVRYGRQQPACHRRYAPYRRQGLFCG